jgi:hypothetical protein
MTANHVGHEIATFPGIRDGIGGRTSTCVGLATPNYGLVCSGVVSWGCRQRRSDNVGRGRISLDCDDPRLRGDRCRAHHWAMGLQSH